VSGDKRTSSENKLVGCEKVRDDQEKPPKPKIGNYQKRGFDLEKQELKFE